MTFGGLIVLAFNAILIQNVILNQFLGTCPFLGVSGKRQSAVGMGFAVIVVITLSSLVSWGLYYAILKPLGMTYMSTLVYILVIAALVQIIEMFLKKVIPSLYRALGIYLPLITTNCAVLGTAKTVIARKFNFLETLVYSFSIAVGFLFVIYIFSTLRSKIARGDIPKAFQGIPIALITAGILAMIFAKFGQLII
ncbi:MAG TPA: Rnf-Nqr domain containing protein [Bacilli bacterium]|jgi:electron transport complex protein RnfA|nr:electron transport complex subunit RsxA [Acholeplasmataceae bacterium]HOA79300.1 Rnf-Nqr domain containing protein [Bacilli bacterium]HPZ27973.1 Rnf-Nqr domain containing protein [Bacilli bacterium]HQC90307.1 Rnf-Nqr domain containing protein [Bacilli bacterium]